MSAPSSDYRAVLDFWFRETAPQQWFARSDAFDGIIRQRFFAVWQRAAQGELADWRGNMQGSSRRSDTCIRPTAAANIHFDVSTLHDRESWQERIKIFLITKIFVHMEWMEFLIF
ncbi:DUF924 family protein [Neisseria sicca]